MDISSDILRQYGVGLLDGVRTDRGRGPSTSGIRLGSEVEFIPSGRERKEGRAGSQSTENRSSKTSGGTDSRGVDQLGQRTSPCNQPWDSIATIGCDPARCSRQVGRGPQCFLLDIGSRSAAIVSRKTNAAPRQVSGGSMEIHDEIIALVSQMRLILSEVERLLQETKQTGVTNNDTTQ